MPVQALLGHSCPPGQKISRLPCSVALGCTLLSVAGFTSLCSQTAPPTCTPVPGEQDCCVLASALAVALLAADWGEDANCSALWLSLQTPALLIIH